MVCKKSSVIDLTRLQFPQNAHLTMKALVRLDIDAVNVTADF